MNSFTGFSGRNGRILAIVGASFSLVAGGSTGGQSRDTGFGGGCCGGGGSCCGSVVTGRRGGFETGVGGGRSRNT